MSGGVGTRLRPLTCNLPKPMVPIFNKPVMEYTIELLKKNGVNDIGVTLCYLPSTIMDYFEDGSKWNVNLKYYIENKPLGTGGSVKNAHGFLDDTFVVISGDAFTNIDLRKAYEFHKKNGSKATLILKREPIPLEYGVVVTDDTGKIIRFLEKPSWGEVFSDTINTGIYILEPEMLNYFNKGDNFDFSKDLFPRLLKENVPMYGYITEEYWCDVGDLDTYIQTHTDILKDDSKHYLLGEYSEKGIWIGEGTTIEKGAKIFPPTYIGKNCKVEKGAIIDSYSVIGDNTRIGEGSSIKRSVIWNNVNISNNCEIRKTVICNDVLIKNRSRIFEGAVVGAYSKIYDDTTINPKIKIWPYKTVGEKVIVKDNIIWEEKISKKLFGYRSISGKFNVDITPELSASIGTAYSSVINQNGTFVLSSDENNLSKTIKNSIISGIMSTGSQIVDIKNSTIPICRFGVKHFKGDGGIHVSTDKYDEDMLHIEFINKEGANIDKNTERKIENTLLIEDFKRCSGSNIKDVVNTYNFSSIYLKHGVEKLKNVDDIREKSPKIIIASPSDNIVNLAETYLKDIGCEVKIVKYNSHMEVEKFQKIIFEEMAELGIIYSENGEKLVLMDESNIIHDEKYYLLSLLIGFKSGELDKAVIPYNYPRAVEKIIDKYEGSTVYSKSNISNIIQEVLDRNIDFQYILSFDSILASGKIIDYIIGEGNSLKEIIKELPPYYYMKREIPCKWDDKGNVLRRLTEDGVKGIELKEGVRFIDDKGWALIIPDEEKPRFNLYIEGHNEEYAEELCTMYDDKIKGLIDS